jgi:hypothetical protein
MVVYRDRSYSNLPAPHNNDGVTPRPLLAPLRPTVTIHYPGSPVGVSYAGDAMRGDVKKKAYISAVQRNAIAQGKSYEYNYFIFTDVPLVAGHPPGRPWADHRRLRVHPAPGHAVSVDSLPR